jgi:hypothetical protein
MSPSTIFNLHLILGYVAWLLCFRAYLLPRLKSLDQASASRHAILHSFRFFGLVFNFYLYPSRRSRPEPARRWLGHVRGLEGHGQRRREPGQDHHFALSWRDRLPSTRA